MTRRAAIAVAILAVMFPAAAEAGSGSSIPAVAEYTEAIPTAAGAVTSSAAGSQGTTGTLAPAVARKLRADGTTGTALAKLATSSAYGAPTSAAGRLTVAAGTSSSVAGAVERSTGGWPVLLVLGLTAVAGAIASAVARRARRVR